jgi:hypothetical protein
MREVIEIILNYTNTKSSLKKTPLNSLNVLLKFISLYNKFNQIINGDKILYKFNLNLELKKDVIGKLRLTRLLLKKSKYPLQLISLSQGKINRNNYHKLIKDFVLGSYSLTSLNNKASTQINPFLNSHNSYSTKNFAKSKARLLRSSITANQKANAKSKFKNRLISKKINYIKGWRSNWLRKFRYLEMLKKYKLDTNDKLILSILKERKYNLNNKMYQLPQIPESSGAIGAIPNLLKINDLESLNDNTKLSVIKNKERLSTYEGGETNTTTTNEELSLGWKSGDLFKNQIIQYKFNRSNAKPINLNKI